MSHPRVRIRRKWELAAYLALTLTRKQGFMSFKLHVIVVPNTDTQICADAHLRGNSIITRSGSIQLTAIFMVQF